MKNKTVLVTGACINTGVAIVEKFASEGYDVVFTGRSKAKVEEAEQAYRDKFPGADISGYSWNRLKPTAASMRKAFANCLTTWTKKAFLYNVSYSTPPTRDWGRRFSCRPLRTL